MDGRLLPAGIDIEASELPARRILNIVFVLMADLIQDVNRDAIIEQLEKDLAGPTRPERETWGTSPSFVAQQRSIMSAYGPPPGWAAKPKEADPSQ